MKKYKRLTRRKADGRWDFADDFAGFYQQTKIEKIIITGKGLRLKLARNSTYETSIASFGKTLFLTEAEAQKASKEFENGKTRAY